MGYSEIAEERKCVIEFSPNLYYNIDYDIHVLTTYEDIFYFKSEIGVHKNHLLLLL